MPIYDRGVQISMCSAPYRVFVFAGPWRRMSVWSVVSKWGGENTATKKNVCYSETSEDKHKRLLLQSPKRVLFLKIESCFFKDAGALYFLVFKVPWGLLWVWHCKKYVIFSDKKKKRNSNVHYFKCVLIYKYWLILFTYFYLFKLCIWLFYIYCTFAFCVFLFLISDFQYSNTGLFSIVKNEAKIFAALRGSLVYSCL